MKDMKEIVSYLKVGVFAEYVNMTRSPAALPTHSHSHGLYLPVHLRLLPLYCALSLRRCRLLVSAAVPPDQLFAPLLEEARRLVGAGGRAGPEAGRVRVRGRGTWGAGV